MQTIQKHIDTKSHWLQNDTKRFRYDGMGNILNLYRNGTASVDTSMDDLTYHYTPRTNQLEYVDDAIGSGVYSIGIYDQSSGNYGSYSFGYVSERSDLIVQKICK